MGQTVKKFVASVLIFSFLIADVTPAFAQANNNEQLQLDPAIFSNIEPDKYTQPPSALSDEEAAEAKKFLDKPTQNLLETLFLLKGLTQRLKMESVTQDYDAIAKIISKRKDSENIDFEVKGVGKAEPLIINTARGPFFFHKVRHNGLKTVMLFLDKNKVDLEFLAESEEMKNQGLKPSNKFLEGLTPEQINEELQYREFISNHMRKLFAKMLVSPWNPKFTYTPLSELVDSEKNESPESEAIPEEVKEQVNSVLNEPISTLSKKSWFSKLVSKSYNLWADLADQQKQITKDKSEKLSLMVFLYDSETGEVESRTINKPKAFSFKYWNDFWLSVWERPSYRQDVWRDNRGLGKMKVILTGDYLMGISFGLMLGGLSTAMAVMLPNAMPSGLSAGEVFYTSFIWSLTFGIFSKTWQNFLYRGTEFDRFLKNWSTGLGQTFNLNALAEQSMIPIRPDGTWDDVAANNTKDGLINQSIKSPSKNALQGEYKHRADTGEAEGNIKLPYYKVTLPWKNNVDFMEIEAVETKIDTLKFFRWLRAQFSIKDYETKSWEEKFNLTFKKDFKITLPWLIPQEWDTGIERKNFEGQKPQLVTTPVGLPSRMGWSVDVMSGLFSVPVGHLLYIALAPIGKVREINYKKKYANYVAQIKGENHPYTIRLRENVEEEIAAWYAKKLYFRGSSFFGYVVKTIPQSIYQTSKEISLWALRHTANSSFMFYNYVKEDQRVLAENRRANQEQTDRTNLLMTVRDDRGRPHPQQVLNVLLPDRTCAGLFH